MTTKCYPDHTASTEIIHREHDLYKLLKARAGKKESGKNAIHRTNQFRRLIRMILYLAFCFPDESATFIPFGLYRSLTLMRKHRVDYVFSTYPSASNLVIGWIVSSVFRKKHVVDLREPWLDKPDWTMRYARNRLCLARLSLENVLEGLILRSAHKVIMNHRWMSRQYEGLVGEGSKLVVIPNGFDDDLVSKASRLPGNRRDSDTLNLIYTGSYYLDHQPDFILKAIARAIEKEQRLRGKIVFHLYGSIDNVTELLMERYSALFTIKYQSHIRRERVFRRMLESDLGVITFPPTQWSRGMIPSKIYEYKKLNIPLLVIGEKDSALQALAEEWGEPFYHAEDTEGIADFLIKFPNCARSRLSLSESSAAIDDYAYSQLTQRFLDLFK